MRAVSRLAVWACAGALCAAFWWAVTALVLTLVGGCRQAADILDALPAVAPDVVVTPPAPTTTQPPAVTGTYRWDGFPRVAWDFPREGWPVKTVKKQVDGLLLLNGRKVEWVGKGRSWSTVVNAIHDGDYHQDIASGQRVTVQVVSVDRRIEGPVGELVWP